METIVVRIPDDLARDLERQAKELNLTKSEVARRRLVAGGKVDTEAKEGFQMIADLVGSAEGLPPDLSSKKKDYLNKTGYGK